MKPLIVRQKKHFYEFDSFLLDETERLLLRGVEPVSLTPKAFDLLLVLVSNAGVSLGKEELMERVWPDAFVEEANLAVNISMLRKALGEMPGGGQYIETLPRRGYRFAAEVTEFWDDLPASTMVTIPPAVIEPAAEEEPAAESDIAPASGQPPIERRRLPGLQALIAARKPLAIALASVIFIAIMAVAYFTFVRGGNTRGGAQTKRLAVLPFANSRPDVETDYLGFALADSVINRLDYMKSLVVRPSSYVEKYAYQKKGPEQIARELDVNTLLMGSYVKDGEDLIVNAQLIDVETGEKLWSEPISVKFDKLIELPDYVARQVVKGLRVNLTGSEGERFERNVSHDSKAFEYFLRSRYLMSTNKHGEAIELLTESVRIDPNNALVWAYLARAYHINALQISGSRAELSEAEADYDQALELDPELPQARLMKAKLFTETGRVEQAVPLLLELTKANPEMADAHWELSYAYRYAGFLNESIQEGERAIQIDTRLESHQFNSYLYAGQYEKFVNSLPVREDAYVVFYRGFAYYYQNDLGRAAAAFDRAYELNQSSVISQIGKALRLAIADKKQEGIEMLKVAEARIRKAGMGDGEITYKFAQAYDALGDKESALGAFDRSVEQGFFCYPYFASDPLTKNIRSEARFAAILEKAQQRQEAFKRKLEEIK
ncbi:MAG TPA: winged helix-turn-helix domain-containing protein [Blastocatellia bacterium]|nr:winged helix-turn-helix domain-containing protein [Blastocatellia bacterium]